MIDGQTEINTARRITEPSDGQVIDLPPVTERIGDASLSTRYVSGVDEPTKEPPQTASTSGPPDQCTQCGARNPGAAGGGTFHPISTTDLIAVELLLRGGLDMVSCTACEAPLAITTTLAVVSPLAKQAVVRLSNLAPPDLHIAEELRQELAGQGVALTSVASADEARDWLLARWISRLSGPVLNAFTSDERRQALIDDDPEAFDPETLIGAALIAAYGVEGAPFTLSPDVDPADAIQVLEEIQSLTLFAVLHRWLQDLTRNVERDLRRHVPSGGLLPGTVERISPALSHVMSIENISFRMRYLAHALLASVCTAAGRPNTKITDWAATWLDFELALERVTAEAESGGLSEHDASFDGSDVAAATRIDAERAARTLTRKALHDAVAARIWGDQLLEVWDPALRAAARAGFAELGHDLYAGLWSDPSISLSVEQVLDAVRPSAAGREPGAVVMALDRMVRTHVHELEPNQVWHLADELCSWWTGDAAQADSEMWAAAALSRLGASEVFLERVGDRPRPFETSLPVGQQTAIDWARADALGTLGQYQEAEAILTRLLDTAESTVAGGIEEAGIDLVRPRRTLAIVRRHLGHGVEAVARLRDLAADGSTSDQLETRHALLVALLALGRLDEAETVSREALALCVGPYQSQRPRFAAIEANLLTNQRRRTEASELLAKISRNDLRDPSVVTPFASALVSDPELLAATDGTLVVAAVEELHRIWKQHGRYRLSEPAQQALRLLALLSDLTLGVDGHDLWGALVELSSADGLPPDPLAALAVATRTVREGDPAATREALDTASAALTGAFTHTDDMSESYLSTRILWGVVGELQAASELARPEPEYQRVTAELGRDLVGRAAAAVLAPDAPGPVDGGTAPWDDVVAVLAGPLGVLEWVGPPGVRWPLLTLVDGRSVRTHRLAPCPVDLDRLGARLFARLEGWHPGRAGDPFALPEWADLTDWLVTEISAVAAPATTIALIEHRELAQLPWHVALTPQWPTLRVPSWNALLIESARPAPQLGYAGCLTVPRYNEAAEVVGAFDDFVDRIMLTMPTRLVRDEQADRAAFDRLLESCDLLAVACHGYMSANDSTIAWLAAADGSRPLSGSVESERAAGTRHRYTWRDVDRVKRTSAVVISAACRSGSIHFGGAAEQLGFYATLRRHGTRTFIAPRWDVPAAQTLPIFADLIDGLAGGAAPPAAARAASVAAAEHFPPWIAYAPSVTGGWWRSLSDGGCP